MNSNLKIDPTSESTLALILLSKDLVKNVKLQDFDDYSNAAHESQAAYISTGLAGVQIVDKLYDIFYKAFV